MRAVAAVGENICPTESPSPVVSRQPVSEQFGWRNFGNWHIPSVADLQNVCSNPKRNPNAAIMIVPHTISHDTSGLDQSTPGVVRAVRLMCSDYQMWVVMALRAGDRSPPRGQRSNGLIVFLRDRLGFCTER